MAINVNIMCQLDLLDNWRRSLENEFMRSVALPSILTFFMKSRNNKDTLALAARAVPELVHTKGEPGSERLLNKAQAPTYTHTKEAQSCMDLSVLAEDEE